MTKEELQQLTDADLLVEKKRAKQSELFHGFAIGFLFAILVFGAVAWALGPKKQIGFLIPMLFPMVFIYRMLKKKAGTNKDLEEVLKERGLK